MYELRERYELTPDRYSQTASIESIRRLFEEKGVEWREKRKTLDYVDLGCGDCRGTRLFTDFLGKITTMPVRPFGVDASNQCKTQCEEKGIEFIQLDLGTEVIPRKDFHVMTLFETIEHVFETDFLIESMRKSIADDGVLLATTLNVACWKNRILVPLGIQPFNTEVPTRKLSYGYRFGSLKRRMETWKPAGHIRPFTLYSLCEMLEDNGFTVVRSYGLENWGAFKFLETVAKNMCTGMLVVAKPS